MSIKIVMLKSGEDVIADVKEIYLQEDGPVVGYYLSKPYIVKLYEKRMTLNEDINKNDHSFDILFTPWAPLSKDKEFNIPFDWVVSIYEPHEDVKNSYVNKMEEKNEYSNTSLG